jgi:hypothetical protein
MIVVVDEYSISVPFPIAAAIHVVGCHHPIRVVVEHHVARPEIHPSRDEITSHVLVAAVRIGPPGPDTVVIGIPTAVMGVVWILPSFVIPVIMPVAIIAPMLVPAFMLPAIVFIISATVVITVLPGCRDRQRSCQCYEQRPRYNLAHKPSLQE